MARLPDYVDMPSKVQAADGGETIEERCFSAVLVCLEGHYTQSPPMGPLTMARVNSLIAKTLEKTHTCRKSRYVLLLSVRAAKCLPSCLQPVEQGGSVAECGHLDMAHQDICRRHPQPYHALRGTTLEPQ